MDRAKPRGAEAAVTASSGSPPQCHTCRKRRIRCDSTRPICRKCTTRGVECLGYAKQKPLVWLHGGGCQNQYLGGDSSGRSEKGKRRKGRPKLIVADDTARTTERTQEAKQSDGDGDYYSSDMSVTISVFSQASTNSAVCSKGLRIPRTPDLALSVEMKRILGTAFYFLEKMYPNLDPIIRSNYKDVSDPKAWHSDFGNFLWHIIGCMVATHKAVQTQQQGQVALGEDVYQYKSLAIRGLTQALQKPESQLADLTLLSVLLFQFVDFQMSATGQWWAHLEGAWKMIELRGGMRAVYEQATYLKRPLAYYMMTDALSTTTTARTLFGAKRCSRQLEYCELLKEVHDYGYETCIVFPTQIFIVIIHINCHRASRAVIDNNDSDGMTSINFIATIQSLIHQTISFRVAPWADDMVLRHAVPENTAKEKESRGFVVPTRDDWALIGATYRAAVLLYCIRSLALDIDGIPLSLEASDPSITIYAKIEDLQTTARQSLFSNIQSIFKFGTSNIQRLRKVVIWPLIVAGVEAGQRSEYAPIRELVATTLADLSRSLGTLGLWDAKTFLENEWNRQDKSVEGSDLRWWDDIFEQVHGRYAFFM